MADPKRIVEKGYDAIADRYTAWAATDETELRMQFVAKLFERIPPDSAILELGCGSGLPVTKALAERFDVTGWTSPGRRSTALTSMLPQPISSTPT